MAEQPNCEIEEIEILAQWEDKAIPAPGVLFEQSLNNGMLNGPIVLSDFAAWIALAGISGVIGNATYDAIKARVVSVVTAYRRQKGQAMLDELKQEVVKQVKESAPNAKLTEKELLERVDAFFAEIRG